MAYVLKDLGAIPVVWVGTTNTAAGGTTTPTTVPSAGAQVSTTAPSAPFYTTWWGIGLIGLAAYFGYKKFIKK